MSVSESISWYYPNRILMTNNGVINDGVHRQPQGQEDVQRNVRNYDRINDGVHRQPQGQEDVQRKVRNYDRICVVNIKERWITSTESNNLMIQQWIPPKLQRNWFSKRLWTIDIDLRTFVPPRKTKTLNKQIPQEAFVRFQEDDDSYGKRDNRNKPSKLRNYDKLRNHDKVLKNIYPLRDQVFLHCLIQAVSFHRTTGRETTAINFRNFETTIKLRNCPRDRQHRSNWEAITSEFTSIPQERTTDSETTNLRISNHK